MKKENLKPLLIAIIVVGILLVIAITLYFYTKPKANTVKDNSIYESELNLIKNAATYYVEEKNIVVDTTKKITLKELQDAKMIFEIKDPKDKDGTCDGYVMVEKTSKEYKYTPYLKCGSNYESKNYKS